MPIESYVDISTIRCNLSFKVIKALLLQKLLVTIMVYLPDNVCYWMGFNYIIVYDSHLQFVLLIERYADKQT